jgi:hypothetical protein
MPAWRRRPLHSINSPWTSGIRSSPSI